MPLDFIGRTDELEMLRELYENNAKIIRVTGRRGVGKTTLVLKFCRDVKNIYFSYRPTGRTRNLKALSERIGSENMVRDIRDAIRIIGKECDDRIVFVVDNTNDIKAPDVPPNMTLVLVGRNLEDADIVLKGFDLRESGYFFPDCMPMEKLLIYAVTGGIPSYMTVFDRNISVSDNIESLFFRENGRFFGEPESLLRSMGIREPEGYLSVLSALSEGNDTINGLMRSSDDRSTAAVLKHIRPLIGTLVERHVPKGLVRASYRITDNLMRFWLRFVQEQYGPIALGKRNIFVDNVEERMDGYLFSVYREVCSAYLHDGYGLDLEQWTEPNENRICYAHCSEGEYAYFVSCGWSRHPAGKETYESLMRYAGKKEPGKKRTLIMFSAWGFRKDMELMSEDLDVDLISLEGMFW